jgi:DNA topoisomerase-1
VEDVTLERAAELLADRRARGPVKRTAKKAPVKAPAKRAAKAVKAVKAVKAPAKKASAKKA